MTDYIAPLHIDVVCDSNLVTNRDVAFAVEAVRLQLIDAAKAWGIEPPGMALYDRNGYVPKDTGVAVIHLINSDGDPDALGSHTEIGGQAVGVVDIAQSGAEWSTVLSHEALETGLDWDLGQWVEGPGGLWYAVEIADAVEAQSYSITVEIMGEQRLVPVSNFILPSWLQVTGQFPYDHLSELDNPHEIAPGGYAIAADQAGNIRYLAAAGGAMFPARKLLPTSRTARLISKGRR